MTTAAIYDRVSEDRAHGRSVAEQEADNRRVVEANGWTLAGVWTDNDRGASRYSRKKRPAWEQLVDRLEAGGIDVLVTWEASRAQRDLEVYLRLRNLCRRLGILWCYNGRTYDLTRHEDAFATGLDALLAEREVDLTRERVLRAVRANAVSGRPHGKLPYGYRREYDAASGALLRQVPDETTAPIVREMYRRIAAGDSCRGVAVDLTRRAVPPPRPGKHGDWYGSTVRTIVLSPTNIAQRVHRGQIVGPASWPPLVDEQLWHAAVARLEDPARPRMPDTAARHLLSGVAVCGVCGGSVTVIRPHGYRTYTCRRLHCVARSEKLLDAYVVDRVLALIEQRSDLTDPDDDTRPDLAALRADLDALTQRMDTLAEQAAKGQISPAMLAKIEARLLPQIHAAETRIRALRLPRALAGLDTTDPAGLWDSLALAARRALIRELVTVKVLPTQRGARGIRPGSVEITPRWVG